MRKFLINVLKFSFLILVLTSLVVTLLIFTSTEKNLPAPNFSRNYSFNEKMRFIANHPKTINTLALGSSMCLNNLDSKIIITELNSSKYINAGVFSASIMDDYLLLKRLIKRYKIKTLLISSNFIDFQKPGAEEIDYQMVEKFIHAKEDNRKYFILHNFNVRYLKENYANTTLNYDPYGAVKLDPKNFKINIRRWNALFRGKVYYAKQYAYLDSIAKLCKENEIKFIFFQSPIRNSLFLKYGGQKALRLHFQKTSEILKKNDQFYVNATSITWDDRYFVDAIHLTEQGARRFTEYCFSVLKEKQESPQK